MNPSNNQQKELVWVAASHIKHEKTSDWFWFVGIVAVAVAVLSTYFGNVLFALLVIVATVVIFVQHNIPAHEVTYKLTNKGVVIDNRMYPYNTLESFWVVDEDGWDRDRILIKSKKMLSPLIVVPLGEKIGPNPIKLFLKSFVAEEEMSEPSLQIVLNRLGF